MRMPEPDQSVLAARDTLIASLQSIVAEEGVIWSENQLKAYESDGLTAYRQLPLVVVLPEDTRQVSEILKICSEHGAKGVPRGA